MAGKFDSAGKAPKVDFLQGGNKPMFGKQAAGPQRPGVKGHSTSGDGGKFAKGGNTGMFGKQAAGPQQPDHKGHATSGDGGKFAQGGSTKMFGPGSSRPAAGGQTAKSSQ